MLALSSAEPGLKPVSLNDFLVGTIGAASGAGIGALMAPPPPEDAATVAVPLTVPVW